MIVFRIVWRLVRVLLTVIVVITVAAAIGVIVLKATNPKPKESSGWALGAKMSDARGETASTLISGRLIVAGGLRGLGTTSRAVSVYGIAADRWARAEPLPVPLHHAAAAAAGGSVYVSGGAKSATKWTPSDALYGLRPGSGWSLVSTMPEGRQGHAMVAIKDTLYVIGGVGDTDRTLVYDIRKDRWTTAASLPEGRDHLRAVVWQKKIVALGGRNGKPTGRVDVYDPKRDEWTPGPPLPEPMSAMAVGVLNGDIHVVGSEDPSLIGGGVSNLHLVLRADGDRWERDAEPALAVHGAAFGADGDRLFIAGGASRNGALSVLSWTNVTQIFTD
jgi:Kelch motif protein/galactose oxidase-like protein